MGFLLDTVAISEMTRARPDPAVLAYLDALDPDQTFLSVITVGEIRFGVERLPASTRRRNLEHWLDETLRDRFSDRILNVDIPVITSWARLVARLEKLGRPLPMADSLIAATALAWDLRIVTRNADDFAQVGVKIENPWAR